jgi:uncharacterized protein
MSFQVAFIEIPAKNMERAAKFYSQLLGIEYTTYEDGIRKVGVIASSQDGGVGISVNETADFEPGNKGPLVYLSCDTEMDALLQRAADLGGKVTMPKTEMAPKWYFGIIEDTEGNAIALSTKED